MGGNGGIRDRSDHTEAGGNGDSANQLVDSPADRNRNRESLGLVHGRYDRNDTLTARSKRRCSPWGDARQSGRRLKGQRCVLREERLAHGKSWVTAW